MAHLITFKSSMFDISTETPNPSNPIAGESLLRWLRPELQRQGFEVTEPAPEDWGWYLDVRTGDSSYMLGASADAEDSQPVVEWALQIHKHRSLADKLRGRNKLTGDDRLLTVVEHAIRAGADASDVVIDRGE
jgi:hypothetical protein